MHTCFSKLTIIGSDHGLAPGRCQNIIRANAEILLIRTLGTNFNEIFSEIHTFSLKKMHLKKSSAKWQSSRLGLSVLTLYHVYPTAPFSFFFSASMAFVRVMCHENSRKKFGNDHGLQGGIVYAHHGRRDPVWLGKKILLIIKGWISKWHHILVQTINHG